MQIGAYRRFIVHQKLLINLNGEPMAMKLEVALAALSGIVVWDVRDHGSDLIIPDVA